MLLFKLNFLIVLLSSFVCSFAYVRSSFFFRNRSADAKECASNNLIGQCMFSFECMQHKGRAIGICIERYYVGSCCYFNSSAIEQTNEQLIEPSTNLASQSKLRRVNRPNNENLILSDKHRKATTTVAQEETKKISFHPAPHGEDKLNGEENDAANFINSTNSPSKLNYSEQTKLINLIDTSAVESVSTARPISNEIIHSSVNYLSTTTSTTNLTNLMSGLYGISQIISELSKDHQKQPTTPLSTSPFAQEALIDKNSTVYNQLTTSSIDTQSTTPTTTTTTTEKSPTTISPIEKYFKNQECGLQPTKKPKARVVGGRNSLNEFPWMVLIKETAWFGFSIKSKCGGSLIHPSYVLTAAHCNPQILGSLFVILGEHSDDSSNSKPIIRAVRRMIIHRDYNANTFENDIALLELASPIPETIMPICLPNKETDVFEEAIVTGYGKLKYGGSIPSILQVAKLPVLENNMCQRMYLESGHNKKIRDTFLCAGYKHGPIQQEPIQDPCEGDSGSPLMAQRANGQWVLLATVSHGIKCSYLPGIYMRTSPYLSWIYNTIQHNIVDNSSRKGIQRFRYQ